MLGVESSAVIIAGRMEKLFTNFPVLSVIKMNFFGACEIFRIDFHRQRRAQFGYGRNAGDFQAHVHHLPATKSADAEGLRGDHQQQPGLLLWGRTLWRPHDTQPPAIRMHDKGLSNIIIIPKIETWKKII